MLECHLDEIQKEFVIYKIEWVCVLLKIIHPFIPLSLYSFIIHMLGVERVEAVEPLFRQLCVEIEGLQLILVVLPGKTPVYGK